LLSLSWSPPLFCGIPEPPDSGDCVAAGVLAGALEDEFDELDPPQPASTNATNIDAAHASLRAPLLFLRVIITSVLMVSAI
jgi:hypothetical protein